MNTIESDQGFILPGERGCDAFVEGWYDLERSPEGMLFQASSRRATLKLVGAQGRVEVALLIAARPEHARQPLRLRLRGVDGLPLSWTLETNGWTVRGGEIDAGEEGMLQLEALNPWSPDALYCNGDARLLGVMLGAARWRKA